MKSRAVKLYLGKIAFRNAKVPRTSYKMVPYQTTTKAGKPITRHRKIDTGVECYHKSASPRQVQFGIHYQVGDVRTRSINANDIQLLNPDNVQDRKDNPITTKAVRGYARAIASATDGIAKELKNHYSKHPQSSESNTEQLQDNDNLANNGVSDVDFRRQFDHP